MGIVHRTEHNTTNIVRDEQKYPVSKRFLWHQRTVAGNTLKCMSELKTSTPENRSPSNTSNYTRKLRARLGMTSGITSGNLEDSD